MEVTVQRNAVRELARRYRGIDTPSKCFALQEQQIALIAKEVGEEEMEATFTLHLVALSRFLNLKQGLTGEHIDFIVSKLMNDYKWLNMADFNLIIDRIKSNHYGSFYENFTAQKFLEILNDYDCERTLAIEKLRAEEKEAASSSIRLSSLPIESVAALINRWKISREEAAQADLERKEAERARRQANERKLADIQDEAISLAEKEGIPYDEAYNRTMMKGIDYGI